MAFHRGDRDRGDRDRGRGFERGGGGGGYDRGGNFDRFGRDRPPSRRAPPSIDLPRSLRDAVKRGDTAAVVDLLNQGVNPNVANNMKRYTPLHQAAWIGNEDIINLLLEHGADPTLQNEHDETPAGAAEAGGHMELAKFLRDYEKMVRPDGEAPPMKEGGQGPPGKFEAPPSTSSPFAPAFTQQPHGTFAMLPGGGAAAVGGGQTGGPIGPDGTPLRPPLVVPSQMRLPGRDGAAVNLGIAGRPEPQAPAKTGLFVDLVRAQPKDVDLSDVTIAGELVVEALREMISQHGVYKLNLTRSKVQPEWVVSLSRALATCTRLHSLSLAHNRLDIAAAKAVADIVSTSASLRVLDLENCSLGPVEGVKLADALVVGPSGVVTLILKDNPLGDEVVALLARFVLSAKALRTLSLEGSGLGSQGTKMLAEALYVNTSLTALKLSGPGNNVGASGAAALSEALQSNCTVTSLDLASAGIGDAGASALLGVLAARSAAAPVIAAPPVDDDTEMYNPEEPTFDLEEEVAEVAAAEERVAADDDEDDGEEDPPARLLRFDKAEDYAAAGFTFTEPWAAFPKPDYPVPESLRPTKPKFPDAPTASLVPPKPKKKKKPKPSKPRVPREDEDLEEGEVIDDWEEEDDSDDDDDDEASPMEVTPPVVETKTKKKKKKKTAAPVKKSPVAVQEEEEEEEEGEVAEEDEQVVAMMTTEEEKAVPMETRTKSNKPNIPALKIKTTAGVGEGSYPADWDKVLVAEPGVACKRPIVMPSSPRLLEAGGALEYPDQPPEDEIFEVVALDECEEGKNNALNALDISGNALQAASLDTLKECYLTQLNLSNNPLSTEAIHTLADAVQTNRGLKVLDVSGLKADSGPCLVMVGALVHAPRLISLNLSGSALLASGVMALADCLYTNTTLKTLILRKCAMDSEGVPEATLADIVGRAAWMPTQASTSGQYAPTNMNVVSTDTVEQITVTRRDWVAGVTIDVSLPTIGKGPHSHAIRGLARALEYPGIPVQSLSIVRAKFGAPGARALAHMLTVNNTLEELKITGIAVKVKSVMALMKAISRPDSTVRTLILHACEGEDGKLTKKGGTTMRQACGVFGDILSSNTTLTSLDLSKNRLGDKGAKDIAMLIRRNSTLKKIAMAQNGIGPEGARTLAEAVQTNLALMELDLSGNQIHRAPARVLGRINKMLASRLSRYDIAPLAEKIQEKQDEEQARAQEELRGGRSAVTSSSVENLEGGYQESWIVTKSSDRAPRYLAGALAHAGSVTELDLGGNPVPAYVAASILQQNTQLTSLGLSNTKLTDELRELVKAVESHPSLEHLDLSHNLIGQNGATLLKPAVQDCRTLTSLDMRSNKLGDAGIEQIANGARGHKEQPSLRKLMLQGNTIAKAGARALADMLRYNTKLVVLDLQETLDDPRIHRRIERNRVAQMLPLPMRPTRGVKRKRDDQADGPQGSDGHWPQQYGPPMKMPRMDPNSIQMQQYMQLMASGFLPPDPFMPPGMMYMRPFGMRGIPPMMPGGGVHHNLPPPPPRRPTRGSSGMPPPGGPIG